jgi:hypothetical protein
MESNRVVFVVLEQSYEEVTVLAVYGLETDARSHVERMHAEAKVAWDRDKTVGPGYYYTESVLVEP